MRKLSQQNKSLFSAFSKLPFNVDIGLKDYTNSNQCECARKIGNRKGQYFLSASLETVYKVCTVEVNSDPKLDKLHKPEACELWETELALWTFLFLHSFWDQAVVWTEVPPCKWYFPT